MFLSLVFFWVVTVDSIRSCSPHLPPSLILSCCAHGSQPNLQELVTKVVEEVTKALDVDTMFDSFANGDSNFGDVEQNRESVTSTLSQLLNSILPDNAVPVKPSKKHSGAINTILSLVRGLLGPAMASDGVEGENSWKDLFVLDCTGTLRLSTSFSPLTINLSSLKAFWELLADEIKQRASCACRLVETFQSTMAFSSLFLVFLVFCLFLWVDLICYVNASV